ncbi:MAG: (4Fe-4S)-binding protein [Bacteroidota bacterium]
MEKEIVKTYPKGELTIVWKPQKCIHSEICWRTLPEVYDPKGKPWIKPENASMAALQSQIAKCPSGALTYTMANEASQLVTTQTACTVVPNGPLLVQGDLSIKLADGSMEHQTQNTAFCRCGASENKPYCDGSHKRAGFVG